MVLNLHLVGENIFCHWYHLAVRCSAARAAWTHSENELFKDVEVHIWLPHASHFSVVQFEINIIKKNCLAVYMTDNM